MSEAWVSRSVKYSSAGSFFCDLAMLVATVGSRNKASIVTVTVTFIFFIQSTQIKLMLDVYKTYDPCQLVSKNKT